MYNFDTLDYGLHLLHIQYGYSMVSFSCVLILGYFSLVPNFTVYKSWYTLVYGINSLGEKVRYFSYGFV